MSKKIYLFLLLITASWYGVSFWVGLVTIQPLEILLGISVIWVFFLRPADYSSPVPLAALGMLIVMVLSTVLTRYSIALGLIDIAKLALGIVALILMRRMLRDSDIFGKAWRWLCWGVLVSAALGMFGYVVRFAGMHTMFAKGATGFVRVYGLNSDPNRFGALTSIVVAMMVGMLLSGERRRWRTIALLLVMVVALFLSGSRGAVFSMIGGIVLGSFILRFFASTKLATSGKAVGYALVALFLLAGLYLAFPDVFRPAVQRLLGVHPSSDETATIAHNVRWNFIADSIPFIKNNLVFGTGPGSWGLAVRASSTNSAHNTYVSYLVENGVSGLALYLFIVLWLYVRTIITVRQLRGYPGLELRGMGVGLVLAMTCNLLNMNTFESGFLSYEWIFFGILSAYCNVVRRELDLAAYEMSEEYVAGEEVALAYGYS